MLDLPQFLVPSASVAPREDYTISPLRFAERLSASEPIPQAFVQNFQGGSVTGRGDWATANASPAPVAQRLPSFDAVPGPPAPNYGAAALRPALDRDESQDDLQLDRLLLSAVFPEPLIRVFAGRHRDLPFFAITGQWLTLSAHTASRRSAPEGMDENGSAGAETLR
jgi:hypothetical protein